MQLIRYRGVAIVFDGDCASFVPIVEARGFDDPLLRFAAAMCRFAMEIEQGLERGPYTNRRAEAYARGSLIAAEGFAALAALPDAYLAACFGVPAEQVPLRRVELGLGALAHGADRRPG
jgi:hypothetical protein